MKSINAIDVQTSKEAIENNLNNLYEGTEMTDNESMKRTYNYFDWLNTKTEIIIGEKDYTCSRSDEIKRGSVVWLDFGFNIGCEFGGRHPAIVLRRTGDSIFVAPVSSQEPSVKKHYHVKIEKVYGFKNMIRWTNVLKVQNVSIQRVDCNASIGNIKGYVLNEINEAIKKSHIF